MEVQIKIEAKSPGSSYNNDTYHIEETVERIIKYTEGLVAFWKDARGWAPIEAADLLSKSRLDWQASLSRQLPLFLDDKIKKEEGGLILGWTTLGSLVEGVLKLFLSVWYKEYQSEQFKDDIRGLKDKTGNLIDPDDLVLEKLRVFFSQRICPDWVRKGWQIQGEIDWIDWILKIQHRRNAIHAFKHREIGTFDELHADIKRNLLFLRKFTVSFPYPGEEYKPRET